MAPKKQGFIAWQDVYKSHFKGIDLYIKFQLGTNDELILSFNVDFQQSLDEWTVRGCG